MDYEYRTPNKRSGKLYLAVGKGKKYGQPGRKSIGIGFIWDITEARKLRELQATLEAEKEKRQKQNQVFLANMSYEIQNTAK